MTAGVQAQRQVCRHEGRCASPKVDAQARQQVRKHEGKRARMMWMNGFTHAKGTATKGCCVRYRLSDQTKGDESIPNATAEMLHSESVKTTALEGSTEREDGRPLRKELIRLGARQMKSQKYIKAWC